MSGLKARFLDPKIWMDDKVLMLSPMAKLLFVAMLTQTDDEGRIQIQSSLGLTLGLSPIWPQLGEILTQKLYVPYLNEGRKYAFAPNWRRYQNPKYKAKSHIPDPKNGVSEIIAIKDLARFCPDSTLIVLSGSGSGSGSGQEKTSCSEPSGPLAKVEAIILNTGQEWLPTHGQVEEWTRLYPAVDIKAAFREIRAWCIANPTKRKTPRGVMRFINSWLSKAQNSTPPPPRSGPQHKPPLNYGSLGES